MNVIVTGASGFVGTNLCRLLVSRGDDVTGVGRSERHRLQSHEQFKWISADTTVEGRWQESVRDADVIINLAGKNIFGYWTEKYRSQIYQSRVLTTSNIVSALADGRKAVLLNASAIGYYGDRGDKPLTEADSAGDDFLAKVCIDWEDAALKAQDKGARVVLMRFGVVLGKDGGALEKMVPAFKLFVGGPLGSGLHWFPWIHMDDLLNAALLCMENSSISGPVNFVAPGTVRHREFASELGRVLNRPSFIPAPGFMIKAIIGELGQTFLSSQRATPDLLNRSGFSFQYGDIRAALQNVLLS